MDPATDGRQRRLQELARELRRIDPERDYFQLTLTATDDEKLSWGAYSHFVAFTDESRRFELREASLVKADVVARTLREAGEPCIVVNDERALSVFLSFGGHALVEKCIAERWLPDVIAPSPVARSGLIGFRSLQSVTTTELQHAPTRKQRMRILKRDGFRCRICGERPADNVHVKLHVHHIRMWSRGGLTEDANLITICETCHDGLDPHEDCSLFALIPGGGFDDHLVSRGRTYVDGVRRYRGLVRDHIRREKKAEADASSSLSAPDER